MVKRAKKSETQEVIKCPLSQHDELYLRDVEECDEFKRYSDSPWKTASKRFQTSAHKSNAS